MANIATVRSFFNDGLGTLNFKNLSVEGTRFEPKANDTWVRAKLLPRETENVSLGASRKRLQGLMQVDVFVPRKDGYDAAMVLAQQVLTKFDPSSYELEAGSNITIYAAWVEASREEPTYLHLPVFIRWEAIV